MAVGRCVDAGMLMLWESVWMVVCYYAGCIVYDMGADCYMKSISRN
jgi:hypothetical protein